MGVDEHLLSRLKPKAASAASFDNLPVPDGFPKPPVKLKPEPNDVRELRSEIRHLTSAVTELLQVFSRAHDDIKAEPAAGISGKMDKLIEQNEEIGRALLMLLELHREHLPQIAKHTRLSSELKLRRPPAHIFSQNLRK